MANRKNQNEAKPGQGSRDTGKEESSHGISRQKEADQEDNEENDSDLQKAALLSALNIETRRRHGEEQFDDDAADEEEYENNDDDDDDDD